MEPISFPVSFQEQFQAIDKMVGSLGARLIREGEKFGYDGSRQEFFISGEEVKRWLGVSNDSGWVMNSVAGIVQYGARKWTRTTFEQFDEGFAELNKKIQDLRASIQTVFPSQERSDWIENPLRQKLIEENEKLFQYNKYLIRNLSTIKATYSGRPDAEKKINQKVESMTNQLTIMRKEINDGRAYRVESIDRLTTIEQEYKKAVEALQFQLTHVELKRCYDWSKQSYNQCLSQFIRYVAAEQKESVEQFVLSKQKQFIEMEKKIRPVDRRELYRELGKKLTSQTPGEIKELKDLMANMIEDHIGVSVLKNACKRFKNHLEKNENEGRIEEFFSFLQREYPENLATIMLDLYGIFKEKAGEGSFLSFISILASPEIEGAGRLDLKQGFKLFNEQYKLLQDLNRFLKPLIESESKESPARKWLAAKTNKRCKSIFKSKQKFFDKPGSENGHMIRRLKEAKDKLEKVKSQPTQYESGGESVSPL